MPKPKDAQPSGPRFEAIRIRARSPLWQPRYGVQAQAKLPVMTRPADALPLAASALDATQFWTPWEYRIRTFRGFEGILGRLLARWPDRQFAWRGMADLTWPLHSSLYRRLWWSELRRAKDAGQPNVLPPDEAALYTAETGILADMHRWGLHNGARGRLSVMSQLATAQHFGIPTRLIDVTLNAYIGLWFAVSEKDDRDGRLWAIDITKRLMNEQTAAQRDWEDALHRPWSRAIGQPTGRQQLGRGSPPLLRPG